MDIFRYCVDNSVSPLCYNGNLCSTRDIASFSSEFPDCPAVMLGRGLIADPAIACSSPATRQQLQAFVEELTDSYVETFGSERNTMFRMKENWFYLLHKFENSERLGKRLRKTTDLQEYRAITREIFETLPMRAEIDPDL